MLRHRQAADKRDTSLGPGRVGPAPTRPAMPCPFPKHHAPTIIRSSSLPSRCACAIASSVCSRAVRSRASHQPHAPQRSRGPARTHPPLHTARADRSSRPASPRCWLPGRAPSAKPSHPCSPRPAPPTLEDPPLGPLVQLVLAAHLGLALRAQVVCARAVPCLIGRLRLGKERVGTVASCACLRAERSVFGVGLVDLVVVLELRRRPRREGGRSGPNIK